MSGVIPPAFSGVKQIHYDANGSLISGRDYVISDMPLYQFIEVDININNSDGLSFVGLDLRFNNDGTNKYTWIEELNTAGVVTSVTQLAQTAQIRNNNMAQPGGGLGADFLRWRFSPISSMAACPFEVDFISATGAALPRRSRMAGIYQTNSNISQINIHAVAASSAGFTISVLGWGK